MGVTVGILVVAAVTAGATLVIWLAYTPAPSERMAGLFKVLELVVIAYLVARFGLDLDPSR